MERVREIRRKIDFHCSAAKAVLIFPVNHFNGFLSNAIKFTPPGGRIDAVYNSDNECTFEIADTGIGMDESVLKRLFSYKNSNNRKGTEGEESAGTGFVLAKEFFDKIRRMSGRK